MSVAVLVPWRTDDKVRLAVWAWLVQRWQQWCPDWEIVTGACPDGPWSKGAAIADALAQTSADVLVIADADVWCDRVASAVTAVEEGKAKWAVPHRLVKRLSEDATRRVLDGREALDRVTDFTETHEGRAGGGVVVVSRDVLEGVPMDPRFTGWGQEDESWAVALRTMAGEPWRSDADLFHLWHPPADRQTRAVGSAESLARYRRYQAAAGNQAQMRTLVAEYCTTPMEGIPVAEFVYFNKNNSDVFRSPRRVPRLDFLQNWELKPAGWQPGDDDKPPTHPQLLGAVDDTVAAAETQPESDDEPAEIEQPSRSAAKSEWVAYAKACGASDDEIDEATKADLVAKYGK